MSALLKASQGRVDATNAQEYVDNARIKKSIIEDFFPSKKDFYEGSSKLLDVDAWIRKAPKNVNFLAAMATQLDAFFNELTEREAEVGEYIAQNVAQHFGVDPSDLNTHELKMKAALMSDQQCRDALPLVLDLLQYQVKRVGMEMEQRKCFLHTKSANKNITEIYLETAKELAEKVDQLENTVRDLSSTIRTMEKQASKVAAKLAKLAETVEAYVGGAHPEKANDSLKRLASSIDKLSSLPSLNDSNIVKKDVCDRLLEAHDKLLHEVNCLKVGRERYRAHIDDLKAKLNAAKQPNPLVKKNKK